MIGPSIERTKGGIASVIHGYINSNAQQEGFNIEHLVSHVEGSSFEKIAYVIVSVCKFMLRFKVSVTHIHTASDASFYRKSIYALLSRWRKIPTAIHVHGADFDTFYANSHPWLKRYIRYIFKKANSVIVLSSYWKDFFEKNLELDNIKVLFNAVDCSIFNECVTDQKQLHSFLFLGRLGERKGIYDLIKAIDILINTNKQKNLRFIFAGDGEVEEVKGEVSKLGLTHNVEILGWIDLQKKIEVLKQADTIVLPSYNEGLPVALLEAMAAGKIVLSTTVGGIPDLIKNDENGYLITPGDVISLAKKIKEISENKLKMTAISKNNINKIQHDFNSQHINKDLFKLYHSIAV